MRIDPLPSGGWAELFDPHLLPYGRRKPLQSAAMEVWQSAGRPTDAAEAVAAVRTTDVDAMMSIELQLVSSFVREWSHGTTPWEDPAVVDDVPAADIDHIRNEAYKLMPNSALVPSGASAENPFGSTKPSSKSGTAAKRPSRPKSSKPRGSGVSSR